MNTKAVTLRPGASDKPNYYQNLQVLFIISHSPEIERGGGASICLYDLILDLQQRYNVTPSVLVFGEGELSQKCRELNIEVFVMKYQWWTTPPLSMKLKDRIKRLIKYYPKKIRDYFRIKKLFRNKKFDIVHSNTCVIDIGSKIAVALCVPHVWHLREYDFRFYPSEFLCTEAICAFSSCHNYLKIRI